MVADRPRGFNAKGEYIGQFGEEGSGEGQFKNPGGIALAAEGKLWVADTANSRVSGWKRTVSRTSYVQGAHGLVEQRSAGETSFPLPDAHGDITAIADQAGEVSSRQSYDPWGAQLSGPALEMGYLGAQERRADPMSGLIQMGARSYDPQLGAFLSEDVVYGHIGTGTSFDRYAYAWDNPVNLYDLDGRFPSPSDIGDAVGGTVQDLGNAGGDLASQVGDEFSDAGRWTAGAGRWVGDRASDFWKVAGDYALACLKNGAWGAGLGAGLGVAGGGAGAAPGAIIGGLSGCGQGLLQEGLRKSGHDRAAEVIEVVGAGKDVRHGVNVFRKTAPPELIERLKELPHVFF